MKDYYLTPSEKDFIGGFFCCIGFMLLMFFVIWLSA